MDSTRNPVHVSFDGETPQSVPNTPTRSSDDVKKPRRVSSGTVALVMIPSVLYKYFCFNI